MNLLSFEEYLEMVNGLLYEYYTSPVRNAKNEKIAQLFWNDEAIQRLPYLRGFILAMNWNEQIKRRTKGKSSLDDIMQTLFKKVKKSERPFSRRDIESAVEEFLGKDATKEDVEQHILKGKTLTLDERLFQDLAAMEWMEDFGFNLKKTEQTGWIEGVIKESRAYRAGLRNGQYFVKVTTSKGEVVIQVSEDGRTTKEIKFSPENKDQWIPQFVLLTGSVQRAA